MSGYLHSERQQAIEEKLARQGRVIAADLALEFATSEDTIRRDLRTLAAAGLCRRVYGGALPAAPSTGPVSRRADIAAGAKMALGAALARLIEPGMTVFLDTGSTNIACARQITTQGVTVVTHAPAIASVLVETPGVTLVVIGGRIDPMVGATIGARALRDLEGVRPDLALLGVCGLDAVAGLTANALEDAAFKQIIAARSGAVALAATREKLGTAAPFAVIAVDACDILVLDAASPPARLAEFRGMGPRIIEVETGA